MTNDKEINLGYGEPYRNFIYIDDMLDAWQAVIENPDKVQGQILCIGPNDPIKIKDYVQMIADKLEWKGEVFWNTKPKRPGEIYLLNSSNEKITSLLGWEPKVSLNDGVDRTIAIWKDLLENDKPFNNNTKFSRGK